MLEEKQRRSSWNLKKKRYHRRTVISSVFLMKGQSSPEMKLTKARSFISLNDRILSRSLTTICSLMDWLETLPVWDSERESPESGYSTPNYVIRTASDNANLIAPTVQRLRVRVGSLHLHFTLKTLESESMSTLTSTTASALRFLAIPAPPYK